MLSSISITAVSEVKPVIPVEPKEVEQLTQERLEELWNEMVEKYSEDEKFHELVASRNVELKNNNLFFIKVPNNYFDNLFREFQERINDFFHQATGNYTLSYKTVIEVVQQKPVVYLPRDKFESMAAVNHSMYTLRKLFPDIDF